jgi:hypothetical protein
MRRDQAPEEVASRVLQMRARVLVSWTSLMLKRRSSVVELSRDGDEGRSELLELDVA